ncbi:UdgX family uracil-DNA binding protein [Streptacidiphilus monticola]|uniref:Type-4 uracil-DNA glycosylase n=1 Tax=Streptacidiphilus monticola TaxID=2161674 RepID=A0ABW1FXN8_9ACTN
MNAASTPEAAYDAGPFVPEDADLAGLARAAADCRGCPLHEAATRTVFGEGSPDARVVLIGEQPGDQEDRQGHPFVGPAGRELSRALEEAGIDPELAYITNAVKHFKFTVREERGKRRMHESPSLREVRACRPWLDAELSLLAPDLVVALGATAARGLLGSDFRLTRHRGELQPGNPPVLATIHPSAVLRSPDRGAMHASLVSDLTVAARTLAGT